MMKALVASLAASAALALTGAPVFAHSVPASSSTAATANPSPAVKLSVNPPQPGMGGPYSSYQSAATSVGITHPEYRFFIQLPSGKWVSEGHFHRATMFSFPRDTQAPGQYLVVVDVRSGSSPAGPVWSSEKTVTVQSTITVS